MLCGRAFKFSIVSDLPKLVIVFFLLLFVDIHLVALFTYQLKKYGLVKEPDDNQTDEPGCPTPSTSQGPPRKRIKKENPSVKAVS
jgi:hypothetical protein